MNYFIVLGNQPALSRAEIEQTSKIFFKGTVSAISFVNRDILKLSLDNSNQEDQTIHDFFLRLGGSIKIAKEIPDDDLFLQESLETYPKDVIFGISYYPAIREIPFKSEKSRFTHRSSYTRKFDYRAFKPSRFDIKKLAHKIKSFYRDSNRSVRYVLPMRGSNALNAAQLEENKLLEKGYELILIQDEKENKKNYFATTIEVQKFKEYVKRDLDRPFVDPEMGMLPVKLARIMVNLAGVEIGRTIWDPFCGSGTTLIEALLLGYDVVGSDIDKDAVENTIENIKWLAENYDITDRRHKIFKMDITRTDSKIIKALKKTEIGAVVCEPFMGPPQRKVLTERRARELVQIVSNQYRALFDILQHVLQKDCKVVCVVPSYKTWDGWVGVSMSNILSKKWICASNLFTESLHWERKNSIISRSIMIFTLKD